MEFNLYDFDGTIYNGDSSVDFYFYCVSKKFTIIKYLPKFLVMVVLYKLKIKTKEQMKESLFCFVKDFSNLEALIETFWDTHEKNLKQYFLAKNNHDNDIIISASPEFLIKPIGKRLKVKDVLASPVDIKKGKYHGLNCRGKEKVRRFKEKYKDAIVNNAYGDSDGDYEMFKLAKCAYLVHKEQLNKWRKKL